MKLLLRRVQCRGTFWKNVLAVFFGCLLVVSLFGSAEGALRLKAWLVTPAEMAPIQTNSYEIVVPHPLLGFHPRASSHLTADLSRGGHLIYSVTYHIDPESHRVTPLTRESARTCTALFLGCSFTFGTGVEDSETLPAQFGIHTPGYYPVNAGFTGYGLQQVWLQVTNKDFLNALPAGKGIVVYTFIDHHVNRLVGTPDVLSDWKYALPWLVEQNGRVEHRGTFAERNPLQYVVNRYCRKSHFYLFLNNRLGSPKSSEIIDSHMIDFTARVIVDAAEHLKMTRPDWQFWVMFFPDSTLGEEITRRLKNSPVKCLDYARLLDGCELEKEHLWYKDGASPDFGHPKPVTYLLVAQQLAHDLPPCD